MRCSCKQGANIYTVGEYLSDCVNFAVPDGAVTAICAERDIEPTTHYGYVDQRDRDLLKADLFVWICVGPTKVNSTSDSDNGWSHSEGGYQLTDEDKDRMLAYAKTIYDKYGEEFDYDDSVEVTVSSFGIQPCDYNEAGIPLPHEVSL